MGTPALSPLSLFEPDNVWSYEIGAKTQWLDGRLTANVAAFYNDWRDLQVSTFVAAGLRATANRSPRNPAS